MTATQTEKLARLAHYGSQYEIVAVKAGETVLLGYAARHSRSGLIAVIRRRGEDVVMLTGSEEFTTGKKAADPITCGPWLIKFSGRTQREAIMCGERPWIGDVVKNSI